MFPEVRIAEGVDSGERGAVLKSNSTIFLNPRKIFEIMDCSIKTDLGLNLPNVFFQNGLSLRFPEVRHTKPLRSKNGTKSNVQYIVILYGRVSEKYIASQYVENIGQYIA